ncbi:hypothetical protein BBH99_07350 [Chryseobacterium contaminans]|uniref:Uncharacterized protein n=1 Tax=Chryseobacterium contaminans TaxID=1423959 RepID=A0A1M6Z6W5_9FLAO|nr:hypothetical protein [Chryseobacterium contaminans]OCA78784.1 hypothetical protein BBH99_07350 [Chryseobacterium contaminans]SHL26155.1 hypothetical protein SAMN05444407_103107 [Chryseobacterium contaminans]
MNKADTLKKYIETESFEELSALNSQLIFWVDWREEDDAIVEYCEKCINTGTLNAEMGYSGDELLLTIKYKDQVFTEKVMDRDPTLIFLNRVLQPDYEIRFCKGSDGSDTLAFLPLSKAEWLELENIHGKEKLDDLFEVINQDTQMFSKEWDFE